MRMGDIIQVKRKKHSGPGMKNEASRPCCRRPSNRPIRRRGVVLVWAAILIIVMTLCVGLFSLDTGKLVYNVQQLQNAADAAALAGALYVKTELPEFTREKTHDMGLENAVDGLPVMLRWDPSQPQPATFPTTTGGSYDYTNYDIVVGRWVTYNQTFVPTLDSPNAVLVIARRNAALTEMGAPPIRFIWGPIIGEDDKDAFRFAVAFCNSSNGAGFIVLSPEDKGGGGYQTLDMTGNPIINIDNGGIHVNSQSHDTRSNFAGASVGNESAIDAGFFNIVGTVDPPPSSDVWEHIFANAQEELGEPAGFTVLDYHDGVQHIDDPLAAQMLNPVVNTEEEEAYVEAYYAHEPEYGPGARLNLNALLDYNGGPLATYPNEPTVTTSKTLSPGYYPNGMTITNGVDVVLQPNSALGFLGNIFIFGGGQTSPNHTCGLSMNGGTLTGHGVTCYVTETLDSTGSSLPVPVYGVVKITGGDLDLQSPGDFWNQSVEGLNGITIWQDPAMPLAENDQAQLNGEGSFLISGTIYFPDPLKVHLSGNLGDTGNQILCGRAEIAGTASIHVNYDGRNEGNNPNQICIVK